MTNEKKIEKMDEFKNVLDSLSKNYAAFGSRIGFVVYQQGLEQVSGRAIPLDKQEQLQKISDFIYRHLEKKYTELLFNQEIIDWLNTTYDENYLNLLKKFEERCSLVEIKEFLRGQKEAYRHTRVWALKRAVLDNASPLLNDELNIAEIKASCDKWFEYIIDSNMKSFMNMSEDMENAYLRKFVKYNLEDYRDPDYLKWMAITVLKYALELDPPELERVLIHKEY